MPSIMPDELEKIATALLVEAGASEEESKVISRLSIGANLAGHDSHGIIQIPTYIDRVNRGHIVPGAEYEIVKDTPTTTVVDGHWGFGYSVTERLMRETIEKARTQNIAAATVYRQSHIGRLAAYPLMAAEADMIGMITADSGRSAKAVVPFGGREKRLGTNPISIAMPSNLDGPFFLDMATSAVAAGKINLAQARGGSIPSGWVVKADGEHTTDPNELKNGGAILPLGGDQGHKGYGLSSIVEIFSGILTGLGFGHDPSGRHNDGCFISVFNVSAFRDLQDFKDEVTEFAAYLKSSETAPGFDEVLYPGEIEYRNETRQRKEGIFVEDSTWGELQSLAEGYNIASELPF
ncbi:MAG: Ldh family oxidoreductase [Chloroflexota bacterium]|mgnify:FL=1|jgi:LDH2 family malate/lactate/ureidoglycolate dehydrogenase|nr:Ldh family oxidoreductase [Chloroflexota bacterium]MEE3346171.1 Ldh family oxidoreductase [Chloroflexota bacterium]|tara:strand:- start:3971 stop:5020 length:1050 start_codon:yes stop_codon:yes gene_type:complete